MSRGTETRWHSPGFTSGGRVGGAVSCPPSRIRLGTSGTPHLSLGKCPWGHRRRGGVGEHRNPSTAVLRLGVKEVDFSPLLRSGTQLHNDTPDYPDHE